MARHGLLVAVENRPVMLFKVTQALADINSGVDYVDIVRRPPHVEIFLESELEDVDAAVARIGTVDGVLSVTVCASDVGDLRQADHHHGGRRASRPGRGGRHRGGGPPQYPRRAHLRRHDSPGR